MLITCRLWYVIKRHYVSPEVTRPVSVLCDHKHKLQSLCFLVSVVSSQAQC